MLQTIKNGQKPAKIEQEASITDQQSTETAKIDEKLALIEQQITVARQELATITPARQARAETLEHAKNEVAMLESGLANANTYAKYAAGTADEQEAIKSIQAISRALASAKTALAETEQTTGQAEEAWRVRKTELTAQLAQWQTDLQSIAQELQLVDLRGQADEGQTKAHLLN